jgi:putative tryptophan/tyrosine transport system substrate-binding protein
VNVLVALVVGLLLAPLAANAQPPTKIPRIGVLAAGIPTTYVARYEAFREGLRELGYEDGRTIAIEYRYAEGKLERLPELAAELVRLNVDLILASSAPETAAAKRATTSIPIVFAAHGDPVGTGHVAGLARPGGNITGISGMSEEMATKRLELLKGAFPRIARVAVLWNAANPAKAVDWRATQRAARVLGVTLQSREVRGPEDFAGAFAAMRKQRPDALMTLSDPLILHSRTAIVAFATKERLPAIYGVHEFIDAGGLMVYDSNVVDLYRRAAGYVHKILQGAKPADLTVQQPTKFELIINLKTARALGLTIPPSILGRADEVIE